MNRELKRRQQLGIIMDQPEDGNLLARFWENRRRRAAARQQCSNESIATTIPLTQSLNSAIESSSSRSEPPSDRTRSSSASSNNTNNNQVKLHSETTQSEEEFVEESFHEKADLLALVMSDSTSSADLEQDAEPAPEWDPFVDLETLTRQDKYFTKPIIKANTLESLALSGPSPADANNDSAESTTKVVFKTRVRVKQISKFSSN